MLHAGIFKGVNAVILRNDEYHRDENIFYLLEEKPSNASLFLILRKHSKPVLLVSELELGNYANRKDVVVKKLDKKSLAEEVKKIKARVGLNFECQTTGKQKRLRKLTKARQVDISGYFDKMREVKTQREIKKIKTACRITTEILGSIEDFVKRHKTERQLALKLEFGARNVGADSLAFPVIVASGENSAIPHYATADKKIASGFLIIDFGVVYDGYCSDVTRTYFVGKPTVYHKHMFAVVYGAKQAAMQQCFAGNAAKNVHNAAENVIKNNFNGKLMHSIGHGLGLRVHDFPAGIGPNAKFLLKENMCITVEPGYYRQGFGGVRIEDDVIIKRKKCVELTKAEKELAVLKLR